ncbi:hypothetical protein SGUI_2284 [Serinicoccus hydrothermalis]|uniref:Uncharacterized protein n=1 Tax=Serinicoccus hydrothermalis TaxID=1758689 RepID=A0A1B1NE09_9MICO|nr:hypothetical protein [Serinicoccus hydrothermalis]ANS79680.1 hypothetical protein SGUI_2284 [Serinicoccus hydrothermalis]
MKSFPLIPYATIGIVLVLWWAFTQSLVAAGLLALLLVVAAVHIIKITSGPGSIGTAQDEAEGHVRSSFPVPPERPRGV